MIPGTNTIYVHFWPTTQNAPILNDVNITPPASAYSHFEDRPHPSTLLYDLKTQEYEVRNRTHQDVVWKPAFSNPLTDPEGNPILRSVSNSKGNPNDVLTEMRGHGGITTEPQIIKAFTRIILDPKSNIADAEMRYNSLKLDITPIKITCNLNIRNTFKLLPTDKFGHNPSYIAENFSLRAPFRPGPQLFVETYQTNLATGVLAPSIKNTVEMHDHFGLILTNELKICKGRYPEIYIKRMETAKQLNDHGFKYAHSFKDKIY